MRADFYSSLSAMSMLRLLILLIPFACARAESMTEIRYLDREAEQAYPSRILILGERMRMDEGRDDGDFILFDRPAGMVWLVGHEDRRLTGIPALPEPMRAAPWPQGWRFVLEPGTQWQGRLNGELCVEFRSAPILAQEARMLRDYHQALAGNQAVAWSGTPADLREPCALAVDVRHAGLAYEQGLPLVIRYWNGRSRTYEGQAVRDARPGLFELPADYRRFIIRAGGG